MVRLDTCDGIVPIESDFDDDSHDTLPIMVPPDLSPAMLRLLADCVSNTTERIAQHLERYGKGRDVLIPSSKAAARVRSLRWAR